MKCPNCGGTLNINLRKCEFCGTTFTENELGLVKPENKPIENKVEAEVEREKTMTEKMQEELQKERANRKQDTSCNDLREAMNGAAAIGLLGLFSGIRGFFYNLRRTVCFILLVCLEIAFSFLMVSGKVTELLHGELEGFVAVNLIIIANALLAGIICRIGRIRAGTTVTAVMNFLAVVWVFIYPMIETNFASLTAQDVAIMAVVEMAVMALSVVLSHLVYRRY